MKKYLVLAGIAALAVAIALTIVGAPREARAADDFYSRLSVDEPVVYGNLAIYPLSLPGGGEHLGDFLTLDEAMATGKFSIQEKEEGAEVNTLQVNNKTGKPVVLLAGEMVRGAKQDRIVSYDTVVPPGGKANLDAFCVEAGRWEVVSSNFDFKNEMAPSAVRAAAQGKENQSEVWSEVSKVNASCGVATETDALTASYNDPAYQAKVKEYEKAFAKLADNKDVVGVVVVTEGAIKTGDVFGSHDLFKKLWPRLLTSYAMDACLSKELGGLISPATIKMRLTELEQAQREETYKGEKASRSKAKSDTAEAYEFQYEDKAIHVNLH